MAAVIARFTRYVPPGKVNYFARSRLRHGASDRLGGMKYIFVLLITLCCIPLTANATPGEVPVGGMLPDVSMQGLSGESAMLSSYRGKPLIINVWASYCPPCLAEMGSIERLQQRHGEHFNVIGISIDDYRDRARGFLQKAGTTFPHYIDHALKLENMLGANSIPLTVLVDGEGRVLHKVHGARQWDSPAIIEAINRTFEIQQ